MNQPSNPNPFMRRNRSNKTFRPDDPTLRLRNVLNIVFIALAIAAIVMKLFWPELTVPFFIIAVTAVLIKMGESVVRMSANHKRQQP